MKFVIALLCSAFTLTVYAEDPSVASRVIKSGSWEPALTENEKKAPELLILSPNDPWRIQIQLSRTDPPELILYFMDQKLREIRSLIDGNYRRKLNIQIDGKIVSSLTILIKSPYKGNAISVLFPDTASAVKAAEYLIGKK